MNSRVKDLTGNRYGYLTVLEFVGIKNRGSVWKVKCDCGKEKTISSSSLRTQLQVIDYCNFFYCQL